VNTQDLFLAVDVQNDFCPGGALAVPGGDEIVPLVNRIGARFKHVVLTQDWHPPGHKSFASSHKGKKPFESVAMPYGEQTLWPDHCVQGTAGAAFHKDLALTHAEMVVRKGYDANVDSYSAFFENDRVTPTGLAGYVRERGFKRLIVAGLAFDYCVQYSALDGRRLGFEVQVVADACRSIDLGGSKAAAERAMTAAGVRLARAGDYL
jgi:nicotinamidase/pyrazinamidase